MCVKIRNNLPVYLVFFHEPWLPIYIQQQKITDSTSLCRPYGHIFKMCSVHFLKQLDAVWKSLLTHYSVWAEAYGFYLHFLCFSIVKMVSREAKWPAVDDGPIFDSSVQLNNDFFSLLQTRKIFTYILSMLWVSGSESNQGYSKPSVRLTVWCILHIEMSRTGQKSIVPI